jgi:isoleucyl-tRNA synthetase
VRLNRKRFWQPSDENGDQNLNQDKVAAYQTLYECLNTVAKLSSPIAPFYSEQLYLDLNEVTQLENAESIHLTDFPGWTEKLIDADLEEKMKLAQTLSSLVHSLRKKHMIKVRQPLSRILIPILNTKTREQIHEVEDLIKSEVNVKAIEYIEDTSGILVKKIKPNFKKLGKLYGPKMKDISKAVAAFDQEQINRLEKHQSFTLSLPGEKLELTLEDVEITSEDIPGWSVASEDNITVALDIHITDELKREGVARDLVNRIQNLRKELGLDVQDKIRVSIEKNNDLIIEAVKRNRDYICRETQALEMELENNIPDARTIEIDDLQLKLNIEVINKIRQ